MKSIKIVVGGLIVISALFLSCSNTLAQKGGWQPAVEELRAEIAAIKGQIGDISGLKKRVEELEKLVTEQQKDIAQNTADTATLQDEIAALKKLIADLQNAKIPQLVCVTGGFAVNTMTDPSITNQINIAISDPAEVFTSFNEPGTDDHPWGLRCNDGWINTGCSSSTEGKIENNDLDVYQHDNGCSSDNNEYGNLMLYTTCCKVIQ